MKEEKNVKRFIYNFIAVMAVVLILSNPNHLLQLKMQMLACRPSKLHWKEGRLSNKSIDLLLKSESIQISLNYEDIINYSNESSDLDEIFDRILKIFDS